VQNDGLTLLHSILAHIYKLHGLVEWTTQKAAQPLLFLCVFTVRAAVI